MSEITLTPSQIVEITGYKPERQITKKPVDYARGTLLTQRIPALCFIVQTPAHLNHFIVACIFA